MTRPIVTCPCCHKHPSQDPTWPFCSDRCKTQDLGDWAAEKFKIAAKGTKEDESDEFEEGSEN